MQNNLKQILTLTKLLSELQPVPIECQCIVIGIFWLDFQMLKMCSHGSGRFFLCSRVDEGKSRGKWKFVWHNFYCHVSRKREWVSLVGRDLSYVQFVGCLFGWCGLSFVWQFDVYQIINIDKCGLRECNKIMWLLRFCFCLIFNF